MHWIDWCIMLIPFISVLWLAMYSGKFVRGVADFLAAGRVAGRYVIAVGDVASGLSVITLVALVEAKYQCGFAMSFWETISLPLGTALSLSGYCIYRYRATRALSIGQFLEMRYSRSFRVIAATIRTIAEMITNAIGPAVAANFFIYFLGLPHRFMICGINLPTFVLLTGFLLIVATMVLWPGGRISLLITDCFQSLLSYPVFVVLVGYVFLHFNWGRDIAPVMMDRAAGESYINPFDIQQLRDFNLFALVFNLTNAVLNRAAWIGNDTTGSGKNPHEQKMANILGTWRNGFAAVMQIVIALMIICLMAHIKFADKAHDIRLKLSNKIIDEIIVDTADRVRISKAISQVPVQRHRIGIDEPLSRKKNLDTPYLDATLSEMRAVSVEKATQGITDAQKKVEVAEEATAQANAKFQNFRSLYHQMMMPVALRNIFPVGLMGVFALLMIMLLISTDDSRIFNASSTIVQDMILPFIKRTPSPKEHLTMLRLASVGVAIFFFIVAVFFTQLDYINMFTTIMCSLWLGGAGPIMIFGLYSRFGNTVGAYCSLVFGSGISLAGLLCQRNWADHIYPWIAQNGWDASVGKFLAACSGPFEPFIIWRMDAVKFPINSYEIGFIAMISGVIAYIIGSLVTYRKPYNLDRLLHRGEYADGEQEQQIKWSVKTMWNKLIGITSEYTLGDRIIAWSVFTYNIIYKLLLAFIVVLIWNRISPWPKEWWGDYFYITIIVIPSIAGIITTVWFMTGGIIHLRQLFRDLAKRVDNPLDNGQVDGHVSLADKARLGEELSKE